MRNIHFFKLLLTLLCAFWLVMPVIAHAEEHVEKKKPKGEHEGGGEKGEKGGKDGVVSGGHFAGDLVYVHLSPMILPVINDNGVEQIVTMIIDLQVKDFDAADNMHSNMPKVQNAILEALYGGLSQGSLKNGKLVNLPKVKVKITAALEKSRLVPI